MPKSDAQRHLAPLQDYQDLVAGVGVIRDAIERVFDVTPPAARGDFPILIDDGDFGSSTPGTVQKTPLMDNSLASFVSASGIAILLGVGVESGRPGAPIAVRPVANGGPCSFLGLACNDPI